ncbi:hypothetical protein L228DRAFT_243740 [Xylona heveae TC161]|uniref:Uncharacterized protein n=1 Tax=Xylona heveae (strain CBS 132557 / TC161) TaxID=1328760 RepID=A0A165IJI2_XYLHT|nr:hypothetical protein L228DRAFT_243740 [Xylona heveae TC161]KZF24982.1 hypothetical protein L228DRAFT_243740 [Xylona heveae TC161]
MVPMVLIQPMTLIVVLLFSIQFTHSAKIQLRCYNLTGTTEAISSHGNLRYRNEGHVRTRHSSHHRHNHLKDPYSRWHDNKCTRQCVECYFGKEGPARLDLSSLSVPCPMLPGCGPAETGCFCKLLALNMGAVSCGEACGDESDCRTRGHQERGCTSCRVLKEVAQATDTEKPIKRCWYP